MFNRYQLSSIWAWNCHKLEKDANAKKPNAVKNTVNAIILVKCVAFFVNAKDAPTANQFKNLIYEYFCVFIYH